MTTSLSTEGFVGGGGADVSFTVLSVDPSPGTAPGAPGGFPLSSSLAASTPVTIRIGNAVDNLDKIFVTIGVSGVEEVVYYGGLFHGGYTSSVQSVSGDELTLVVTRASGWRGGLLTVVVSDSPPQVFLLLLPSPTAGEVELAPSVASGPIDHAEAMVARLPQRFRRERFEALCRALCSQMQPLEQAIHDVLSTGLSVDTAVGVMLRSIAHLVRQPTDGFEGDDERLRRYVRARIIANRSSGTSRDIVRIVQLVTTGVGATISADRRGTAVFAVTLSDAPTPHDVARDLAAFIRIARGQGIRGLLYYFTASPTFRLDSGPGLDQGHLATAIDTESS